jgi:hypothetical protein
LLLLGWIQVISQSSFSIQEAEWLNRASSSMCNRSHPQLWLQLLAICHLPEKAVVEACRDGRSVLLAGMR